MCKPEYGHRARVSRIRVLASVLAMAAATSVLLSSTASARDKRLAYMPEASPQPAATVSAPAIMSLISINKQRMYVYDANGFVTTSRVSTGTVGYDTPKGIYSVIQKKVDHESNLYEGAPMPHMQRLLWSGIALHGGEVPRYPASHGCVRLPYSFAEKFFGMTTISHRVIITPDVQAPVKVEHPVLFTAMPSDDARFASTGNADDDINSIFGPHPAETDTSLFRTRAALAAERAGHKDRLVASDLSAKEDLVEARATESAAAAALVFARDQLKIARAAGKKPSAIAEKAERIAAQAQNKLTVLIKRIDAKANRLRADEVLALRLSEAKERQRVNKLMADAETASALARTTRGAVQGYERILAEASTKAATAATVLNLRIQAEAAASKALGDFELSERNRPRPVSVMISSRTGRISVRQGFEPVAEDDIEIRDPKRPLGTFLFTATNWRGGSQIELDWSVIAVNEKGDWDNPRGTNEEAKKLPPLTDAMRAQAALDRIKIPPGIIEIVSEVMKPGSSLIISDYDMARSETSKGTDFIVQMPEVVAKYKTPADIAKAKAKRDFARTGATRFAALGSTRFGVPRYGVPGRYSYYAPLRPVVRIVSKPSPARPSRRFKSSIPSYFGYSRYDNDD